MEKKDPASELGEIVCLEVDKIRPGPIRRSKLDPLLALWARQLFERVGNLIIPTLKQWELGFLCDANPRSELFVWECVAQSYEHFLADHPDCDKARVAADLLFVSMGATPKGPPEDTVELQALYRETRNRMNGDFQKFHAEVFRSLANWPYRQLLLWDDLYREKTVN